MIRSIERTALVIVVALVLLLGGASVASATSWNDIDSTLPGAYGVTLDQLAQVSSGYPDGDWRPWQVITRGQFAKMAVTAFGVAPLSPKTATFTDVSSTNHFYPYVEGAYEAGLMQGVGGGAFGVASPVTREQAIAVVARKVAADHDYDLEAMTDEEIGAVLAAFADESLVSASLRAEVAFAVKQGLVKGNATGMLNSQAPMSRIAAATVLIRAKLPRPVVLDMNDNGRTIKVGVGETIEVILKGNPTTGYAWTVVLPPDSAAILEQVGEPEYVADSDAIGAGGTYTFTFRGLAAGEVALKLEYARSFETEPPLETFSVTVQVENAPVGAATLTLDEEDNGTTVAVKPGDTIDVILEGNPTTGYGWSVDLSDEDAAILEQVGEPSYVPDSGLIGAGGTYTFTFRALAAGDATLALHYSRVWESVPPLETFSVTVAVAPTPAAGDVTPLEGTSWKLEGWSVSSLDSRDFEITATFEEGRMSGKAAVNLYGADCTLGTDGSFSLGPIVQTLMAGPAPAMQAETAYFGLLQQALSYVVDGDELTLLGEGADELLIFAAVIDS
ncbi:MAG: protease inhibitor I42 family protein [Thermoleophilia bacterium]|nr:protease inhibitor I42 family protein [Thermoleophilia bacterium]